MVCEERLNLMDEWNGKLERLTALAKFLSSTRGISHKLDYEKSRDELAQAKADADSAYAAIERHEREHGCGGKANDGNDSRLPT